MTTPTGEEDTGRSRGLRLFLVGLRVLGVICALLISNGHANPLALQETLKGVGWITASVVVFYHLVAAVLVAYSESTALLALFVITDVAVGAGLTYVYGEAYFLLTFALPVMEICAAFGLTAALVSAVLGIMFYAVVYARPLLESLHEGNISAETFNLRLSLSGVQAACAFLMAWLYSLAILEQNRATAVRAQTAKTTELLYRQLAERTEENELIYAAMNENEQKATALAREIQNLRHELDEAYKDLAKARLAMSSKDAQAEEKANRLTDEMWRERQALEDQATRLEQELNVRNRTLEGFRQISGSLSLEETLLALVYHLQSRFPSVCCVVFMAEDVQGTQYLYPEVADAADTEYFRELAIPVGEQAAGWVAATGRSLRVDDTRQQTDTGFVEALPGQGRSALVVPLRNPDLDTGPGAVMGVVYMGRAEANGYTDSDVACVEEFMELASIVVARCLEFRYRVGGGLHDPITGLHNGLYLAERMEEEVRRGRRYTYPVSLLLIDIDGFTPMVDKLGRDVLDNVLRQVAGLLVEAIRDTDTAARIEADDFGILLVHSDRDNAIPIAERIRAEISQTTFGTPGQPLRLTVSVGVAGVPHDASDAQRLKEAAFGAIAEARAQGGNRVATFPR
jgi:diguanylate cyclase (GGDEF)-like protein